MSAKKLLEMIEERGLLEDSVVDELRKQIAQRKVTAETIAKVLVDKGHLTRIQALRMVDEATQEAEQRREARAAQKPANKNDELGLASDGDELGLAPDEDEPSQHPVPPPPPAAKVQDEEEVVMLEAADAEPDEVAGLTPVEDAGAGLTPVAPAQGLTPVNGAAADRSAGLSSLEPLAGAAGPIMLPTARRKRNVWDTKLMVGGGLALLLLILIGGAVFWNLTAMPADERWEVAMDDYRSTSYSQAEAKFETFLQKFPKDKRASEARVRIALCQIRVALNDPERGLERSTKLLPTIEAEDAFALAREELATMLVEIPEGFLKEAKQTDDMTEKEELVQLTRQGAELINNPSWVPSSQRRSIQHRIDATNEGIRLVERDIHQERDLASAIAGITSATRSNNTLDAYQIYQDLIKRYPGLAQEQGLTEALRAVIGSERELVRVSEELIEPLTAQTNGPREHRVVLASRLETDASQAKDQVVAVLAGGSVYGLDAGNGAVLWGRFAGHGSTIHPVRVSSQGDADVLFVDGVRSELVCVAARDGKIKWRLPVGEAWSAPVVAAKGIYVSTRSGKLLEVDPRTGSCQRQSSLPLPLSVSAAAPSGRQQIFQLAEHSNLYVLSSESLRCVDIHYLGHKSGTVAVAPLIQRGHVFVAENYARDRCRLNVLRLPTDDSSIAVAQDPIELKGNVVVPLVAYSRRLLAVTDLGEVRVLDIDLNKDPPCSQAAALAATHERPLAAWPLTDASSLWLADNRLTRYSIQVTTGQIARQEVANRGDTFTGPLHGYGSTLIHTRRRRASAGVIIAAVDIDAPRTPLWQTSVEVPAGRVTVDNQRNQIHVISAAAALFEIDAEVLKDGHHDQPTLTPGAGAGAISFTEQIEFSEGRVALFNPADPQRLLVYDPTRADRLRLLPLKLPQGQVTCIPVAFEGGLLTPSDTGEVLLIDLDSGGNQVLPFQPKLAPGERVQWRRPAVVGDQFVLADDRANIYRVGIKDQPRPFLHALASARLDVTFDSPLAAVGDTAYGVVRAAGSDVVLAINIADLKAGREWDLEGRVTWGPQRVGEDVLVVTDDSKLHCFQAGQKLRWERPAQMHGHPTGPPLVQGDDYVFAADHGAVWRIAGASGDELHKSELGEPLGGSPVAFGTRLLLGGKAGALRVIPMPAGS